MPIQAGQANASADVLNTLSSAGWLKFATDTTLVISAGAITVTRNWANLVTEASASLDELDTINVSGAGVGGEGYVVILWSETGGQEIVIRHNVGNIRCPGGQDVIFRPQSNSVRSSDWAILIFDSTGNVWHVALHSGPNPAEAMFNYLNFL